MTSPEDVAKLALTCARDALDRLVALIGSNAPWADGLALPEIALIEMTQRDERSHTDRATWEQDAALSLLIGARNILDPFRQADDDSGEAQ